MAVIYFITYRVYYLGIFYVTKTIDFKLMGISTIDSLAHVKTLEQEICKHIKAKKVLVTNFIKLMELTELVNPE